MADRPQSRRTSSDCILSIATVCSHTQLKASATGEKDPLVVLDLAKDWRFNKNNFGQYKGGFYVSN